MSFSTCLMCNEMVGSYDKYCQKCQAEHGLPNDPMFQKENGPDWRNNESWDEFRKKQIEKDFLYLTEGTRKPKPIKGGQSMRERLKVRNLNNIKHK